MSFIKYKQGVSVIICCFNSALRIRETLKHIARQVVPKEIPWEVIIVNNGSTDNTDEVAEKEWKKYDITDVNFKIVNEADSGLSNARNKGILEAKFEFIILCDDDNWLDKYYINIAFNILRKDKIIGAVGGQSIASTEGFFPTWFQEYKFNYAVGTQGDYSGNISNRGYLWGAGISFRKSLYEEAFFKYPPLLTDRNGNNLTSGGDSEICKRFLLLNRELHYSQELKFTHYIPQYRLSEQYRESLLKSFISSKAILDKYTELIFIINVPFRKKLYFILSSFLKLIILKIISLNGTNLEREKRWIFFISGLNMNVDVISIQIKNIFKSFK